jgi:pimeloyl-ACP methyl ester carboxylesterase
VGYFYNGGVRFDPALPTVVMVHGAGMDHTVWRFQARYLAHHGRSVLAVDLPGHGRTPEPPLTSIGEMADWLAAEMQGAGVEQAALVGHSMGGLIAMETAVRHPGLVAKAVLVSVSGEMRVHPELQAAADQHLRLAADLIVSWSYGTAGELGGHPQPGTWQVGVATRLLERGAASSMGVDLTACHVYRGFEAAIGVRCPVLVIAGEEDRMAPPAASRLLSEAISGGQWRLIPGAGHMLPTEAPDTVRQLLLDFLGT